MAYEKLVHMGKIRGDIEEHAVSGWMEVDGFGFADVSGSAHTGTGAGATRISHNRVSFSKKTDKTSPLLWKYCSDGISLPLVVYAGSEGRLTLYLTAVYIERCDVLERTTNLTLNFTGMTYKDNPSGIATRIKEGK